MKFKLPKKLRESFNTMIEEQGGFGNLPNVQSWIGETVDKLVDAGEIELGWADQEDTNNIELVKFTNLNEHEMFEGKIPDNVLFIRCENRNNEFAHLIVGPSEKGYDVAVMKAQDSEFVDRLLFHTQEMGFLEALVMYLFNKES